jgi:hypothetical protein
MRLISERNFVHHSVIDVSASLNSALHLIILNPLHHHLVWFKQKMMLLQVRLPLLLLSNMTIWHAISLWFDYSFILKSPNPNIQEASFFWLWDGTMDPTCLVSKMEWPHLRTNSNKWKKLLALCPFNLF